LTISQDASTEHHLHDVLADEINKDNQTKDEADKDMMEDGGQHKDDISPEAPAAQGSLNLCPNFL
jgi:hypothetical protein